LYIYWSTLYTKIKYNILESLKNGKESVTNIQKPTIDFSSIKDSFKNNIYILISAIAICIIMFLAARDTKALTKNFNNYTILMMILIILGFVILSPLFDSNSPHLFMFGGGLLLLIFATSTNCMLLSE
jgi:amino acid transporter